MNLIPMGILQFIKKVYGTKYTNELFGQILLRHCHLEPQGGISTTKPSITTPPPSSPPLPIPDTILPRTF